MAKIPDIRQIQRAVPSGSYSTARRTSVDVSAGYRGASTILAQIAERKTNNQLAKADMRMSIALAEEINAFNDDPDYTTFNSRYTGSVNTRLGEIAATIQDGTARNVFVQQYKVRIAAGSEKVNIKARGKWSEDERGQLITDMEATRNSVIESGDIVIGSQQINARIDAGVQSGYLDADIAAKMKIQSRQDLAVGRLKFLTPEQRVKALKQPWAKFLPSDTRADLKRKADDDLRSTKAQATVDDMTGIPREDGRLKISKIRNAQLREETERRWDYIKGREEKEELEVRSKLSDKWFSDIALGDKTIDDIRESGEWDDMGARLQATMINAQASSSNKNKVPFNIEIEDELNVLYTNKKFTQVREMFLENASTMSPEQTKRWSSVSTEGVAPIEVKGLFSATSTLKSKTPRYTPERRYKLQEALGEWYEQFQELNNRLPNDKEVNDKTDDLIMEFDTTWLWGGTKPVFEMSDDEQEESMILMKSRDPDVFNRVASYFQISGEQPSRPQFMKAFQILKEKEGGF